MKIFVSAGDHSSDRYAGKLVKAIKEKNPEVQVISFGGGYLKGASDVYAFDLPGLSISGFLDPFFKIPVILQAFSLAKSIIDNGVDAVLLLDYYGFNIKVAEYAARKKIPVIYFISPQIWASRYGRIKKLKKYLKKMFVIFPFEEKIYSEAGVPAEFVGHPMSLYSGVKYAVKKPGGKRKIGILPGSRYSELKNHAGVLLESVDLIRSKIPDLEFHFFISGNINGEQLETAGLRESEYVKIVREHGFQTRVGMDICWCCSGTAVLENAFLGIPSICFYRMNAFNYIVAKMLVNVKYIAMPNIIASKEVVPELIQGNFNPAELIRRTAEFLENPAKLMDNSNELRCLTSGMIVNNFYENLSGKILNEIGRD